LSVTNNAQEFFCTPVSRHQFQSGVALRFPPHSIGCATAFLWSAVAEQSGDTAVEPGCRGTPPVHRSPGIQVDLPTPFLSVTNNAQEFFCTPVPRHRFQSGVALRFPPHSIGCATTFCGVRWQSEAPTPLSSPGVTEHRRCTARPGFKRTFQRCFLSVTNNAPEFFCTPVSRHRFQSGVALRFPPHSIGCAVPPFHSQTPLLFNFAVDFAGR
jgi:hypothetical protein